MAKIKPKAGVQSTVIDLWHYATRHAAEKADVQPCGCKVDSYPTTVHGRGKQWRVTHTVTGVRLPSKHFHRKGEAENHQKAIIAGEVSSTPGQGDELLKDYAEGYFQRHYTNARSLKKARSDLRCHILPYFGKHARMRDLTYLGIENWKAYLRGKEGKYTGAPLASATISLIYRTLTGILDDAVLTGALVVNPAIGVQRPVADPRPEIAPWEEDVVLRLLAEIPDRHHAIALLAATAGLRKGEAFAISLEDIGQNRITVQHQVQTEGGTRKLVMPKKASLRTLTLHPETAEALRLHIERYGTTPMECHCGITDHRKRLWHLLFTNDDGRLLHDALWDRDVWHPTLQAAELDPSNAERTGLHQLRHFCASKWIEGGMNELQVRKWLGHKSADSTAIYAHLFELAYQRGENIMQQMFSKPLLRPVASDDQTGVA